MIVGKRGLSLTLHEKNQYHAYTIHITFERDNPISLFNFNQRRVQKYYQVRESCNNPYTHFQSAGFHMAFFFVEEQRGSRNALSRDMVSDRSKDICK
jgi:hypothetical protein